MERQLFAVLLMAVVTVVSYSKLTVQAAFTNCGGTLKSSSGQIKSPQYPFEYPVNSECEWKIHVQERHVIELRFSDFSTEYCCDWVDIYDGACGSSSKIGRYNGHSLPPAVTSTNDLCIRFQSDYSVQYEGFYATYDSRECQPFTYGKTCSNRCSCIQSNSLYCNNKDGSCTCKKGWKGASCSLDIDECQTVNLCPNNSDCINSIGSYLCNCKPGWTGVTCTSDIDECQNDNPCPRNAECFNTIGSYTCPCKMGWNGENCSVDVDECQNGDPCPTNAECLNSIGSYTCPCKMGWNGEDCSADVDECQNDDPCPTNAECLNSIGSYTCPCKMGWNGQDCSVDIDECQNGDPCPTNAECLNSIGSYTCPCNMGWNGENCSVDVDECQKGDPCPTNAECLNSIGSFLCPCKSGWRGDNCSLDVNECENDEHCLRNADCLNSDGNFSCICKIGWEGENCSLDIDECQNDATCPKNAKCLNSVGSYACICNKGLMGDDCTDDVDECQNSNPCARNSQCLNTFGSYTCHCNPGFEESFDGLCDECPDGKFGNGCSQSCQCSSSSTSYCNKTDGTCVCKEWWIGSECQSLTESMIAICIVSGFLSLAVLIICSLAAVFLWRRKFSNSEKIHHDLKSSSNNYCSLNEEFNSKTTDANNKLYGNMDDEKCYFINTADIVEVSETKETTAV